MENMDTGIEAFFGSFEGEDGYQTDTAEETVDTESTDETVEETDSEAQDETQSDETTDNEDVSEAEEVGAEGSEEGEKPVSEQKFTIKVDKETREVGIQEMTELAQKGAAFDRVKGQLEASRQNERELLSRLDAQKGIMEVLNLLAEQTGTPLEKLGDQLYVNFQRASGKSETEARQDLENARLKKENETLKANQSQKQAAAEDVSARAQRDIAEFRKHFPDVQLTEELCEKLTSDIQAGMSLTNAYLKHENARQAAENAELQRRIAASEQNRKNRSKAPTSQRDSGGQRSKDVMDDFFNTFEK